MKNDLTFENFDFIINECLRDLPEIYSVFINQSKALDQSMEIVERCKEKKRQLYWNAFRLSSYCEESEHALNCAEGNANSIEEMVCNIEESLEKADATMPDVFRSEMYQKVEELYSFLTNCGKTVADVEDKLSTNENSKPKEPAYLMFKVINSNLNILNKIAVQLHQMQRYLDQIEYLKYRVNHKYNLV